MYVSSILRNKGHRVATMPPSATLAEAARTLKRERIGAVVIPGVSGTVSGILSERDIVHALAERGPAALDTPISEHMSREVVSCAPETAIDSIMRDMTERRIRHMPVMRDGALVGIVSIGDVVKHRLDELETEATVLKQYVMQG